MLLKELETQREVKEKLQKLAFILDTLSQKTIWQLAEEKETILRLSEDLKDLANSLSLLKSF